MTKVGEGVGSSGMSRFRRRHHRVPSPTCGRKSSEAGRNGSALTMARLRIFATPTIHLQLEYFVSACAHVDLLEIFAERSGAVGQGLLIGNTLKVAFEPRLAPPLLSRVVARSHSGVVVIRAAALSPMLPVLIFEQLRGCRRKKRKLRRDCTQDAILRLLTHS